MTIPEIKKTEKNAFGDNPDAVERVAREQTGHTKGPWEYDDNHRVWDISGCDSEAIATCSTSANARLIASAPSLLDACKLLAPIVGKLAVADGEVFPCDDQNRRRRLIPVEANNLISGAIKLIRAVAQAEGK